MTTTAEAPPAPAPPDPLEPFHPAVRAWFGDRFPSGPTEPQRRAWPSIAAGGDVLVASPTGTGKTLTGFLVAIDRAFREGPSPAGRLPGVVYVSPLRALAADVRENLEVPLEGIRAEAGRMGLEVPELAVAVRTGDTPAAERAAMRRRPPDLLVTTPESLYLLLTARSTRAMLSRVHTVIVDEVHTLARDKRGAHLALSLERLGHLVASAGGRLQRIGLSATQRPLEVVARLLSGTGPGRPPATVVDCGHRRRLDVAIELPSAELEAVASHQQFADVLDRIAGHVRDHRTTLVFVNTRKMAERVAHQLAERLEDVGPATADGEDRAPPAPLHPGAGAPAPAVAAHHGSLSTARRRSVEAALREGRLRAVVATASLELGIDVGPVDLVCQLGSPRSIATFIQRVGRANHSVDGVPAGRLFPLTRDELVECAALLAGVRSGTLDAVVPLPPPLDVLAQQLVAEVAGAGEWPVDGLFGLARRAAPFADLDRPTFDRVVSLVAEGVTTGRGRRGAHLHHDAVNGRLRPRRGALLTAATSGGAIPDTGDYRVVLDPDGVTVGSVHEDFAVEATIGDVFLLGTHSWRVLAVEVGTVRVADAAGAPPSVPFWLGEAPARTAELSAEVGALRAEVARALDHGGAPAARRAVVARCGVDPEVSRQVVDYLAAGRAALGTLPTGAQLVVERFFDETEGTQLVIHSPYGGRINRALGLALRKRFCVSFDFELQAAADDDTVVLSLGPQHSFPLSQVFRMLPSHSVADVLTQAVLPHPMLRSRWRWNCSRALVVPRWRGGGRRPIHLQRMDADDVLAAAWPALAACQDNAPPGPIPVPDHVLVGQTVADCLSEPLDAGGLAQLLARVEAGEVAVHTVESPEPSVLAHGILTGRPYTFLDGAPLEERRSRAVVLARGAGSGGELPVPVDQLAPLDGPSARLVLDQVRPHPRDPDELHDLLLSLVRCRPVPAWAPLFAVLVGGGRAVEVEGCWAATERSGEARAVPTDDVALAECVRGHLELAGPVTEEDLVSPGPLAGGPLAGAPLGVPRVRTGLARLQAEGSAIALPDGRWCARHLLVRLHAAARSHRRRAVRPVSVAQYLRFLARWQHAAPGSRLEGRSGLLAVVEQLAGLEVPAGDWERHVLPARLARYDPRWLDELCLAGEVSWGRLAPRSAPGPDRSGPGVGSRRGAAVPSPATPLAIVPRQDLEWLLEAVRGGEEPPRPDAGAAADVLEVLRDRGACFRAELAAPAGRLPGEVDQGLWDLVARGLVTADAFSAVRSLLGPGRTRRARPLDGTGRTFRPRLAARRAAAGSGLGEGRWALLPASAPERNAAGSGPTGWAEDLAQAVAEQLLVRWGLVSWEVWARESFRVPWRDVVRALRRLEARGQALGGRFVEGIAGEQYALPPAAELLASVGSEPPDSGPLVLAASDPLNLTGLVGPGPRVPAVRRRSVAYRDGLVVPVPAPGAAVRV